MKLACLLLSAVAIVSTLKAEEPISDKQWVSFFETKSWSATERVFEIRDSTSGNTLYRSQKERCKGLADVDGEKWWEFSTAVKAPFENFLPTALI